MGIQEENKISQQMFKAAEKKNAFKVCDSYLFERNEES